VVRRGKSIGVQFFEESEAMRCVFKSTIMRSLVFVTGAAVLVAGSVAYCSITLSG